MANIFHDSRLSPPVKYTYIYWISRKFFCICAKLWPPSSDPDLSENQSLTVILTRRPKVCFDPKSGGHEADKTKQIKKAGGGIRYRDLCVKTIQYCSMDLSDYECDFFCDAYYMYLYIHILYMYCILLYPRWKMCYWMSVGNLKHSLSHRLRVMHLGRHTKFPVLCADRVPATKFSVFRADRVPATKFSVLRADRVPATKLLVFRADRVSGGKFETESLPPILNNTFSTYVLLQYIYCFIFCEFLSNHFIRSKSWLGFGIMNSACCSRHLHMFYFD